MNTELIEACENLVKTKRHVSEFFDNPPAQYPADDELSDVCKALDTAIKALDVLGPRYAVIVTELIQQKYSYDQMVWARKR